MRVPGPGRPLVRAGRSFASLFGFSPVFYRISLISVKEMTSQGEEGRMGKKEREGRDGEGGMRREEWGGRGA